MQFRFSGGAGEVTSAVRPGTNGVPSYTPCTPNCYLFIGTRTNSSRILDVDGDGRPDVVQVPPGPWPVTTTATTYFNQGGQFGSAAGLVTDLFANAHKIVVSNIIPFYSSDAPPRGSYSWEVRSDLIDLDGDGIPEGVNFGDRFSGQSMFTSRVATPTQPARLLVGIDNHRGATTSVTYAAMSNSTVVEQHPELGKAMPHTQWLVQSTTTIEPRLRRHLQRPIAM